MVLKLFPVVELMRVMRPALVGASDLTVGVERGVAPADVHLTSARSRRSRRVTLAATSTRIDPPEFQSGDQAAACWCPLSSSGEVERQSRRRPIEILTEDPKDVFVIFPSIKVLSVKWGQLPQFWCVLVPSCCFV